MRNPDRSHSTRTRSALALAVGLGGIGVALASVSSKRPELRALVLMAWLASVAAFVTACTGQRRRGPGSFGSQPGRITLLRLHLGRWHLDALATIGLACAVTVVAAGSWVLVPLAIVVWAAAAALLDLHWEWLLAGAVGCLAASVLAAAPGAGDLSDDLAVLSYAMAWISCVAYGIGRLRGRRSARGHPEPVVSARSAGRSGRPGEP